MHLEPFRTVLHDRFADCVVLILFRDLQIIPALKHDDRELAAVDVFVILTASEAFRKFLSRILNSSFHEY